MNNIEFIREAINFINAGENNKAITRLEQFIMLNTPKPKGKGKVNIWNWVAGKNDIYVAATGVYYDVERGVAAATDRHILLISKPDAQIEGQNRIVSKNGDEIKAKYPDYQRVVPNVSNMQKYEVDRERLAALLQKIAADKKLKKPVEYKGVNICGKDMPRYLNPAYAKLLLTLPDGIFYFSKEEYRPIRYDSTDGNYTAIFMPLMRPENFAGDYITETC